MAKKLTRIAIAYDFDGTLAPGYMQNHSFIPGLGIKDPFKDFWPKARKQAAEQDADEILAYMQLMLDEAKSKGKENLISKDALKKHGKDLKLFDGVLEWFDRINAYAKLRGAAVDHFIISSGNREIILGTPIGKKFKYIYASGFMFDANGVAKCPALAVNYTNKTQYLFRISKGIFNSYENQAVNAHIVDEERPFPFSNMIYLGDGETDVPSMKMLKYQGGYSVAVYDDTKRVSKKKKEADKKTPKQIAEELIELGRADYIAPADYSDNKKLDRMVKAMIDEIVARDALVRTKK